MNSRNVILLTQKAEDVLMFGKKCVEQKHKKMLTTASMLNVFKDTELVSIDLTY